MNYGAPMQRLLIALGESDCEKLSDGLLAQPVNAVSSLAFTVAAIVLVPFARASIGAERRVRWVFIGVLGATGIGSFLYHGPQGPASHFLHDSTFLATLALIAVANLSASFDWADRTLWVIYLSLLGATAALLLVSPGSTNVLAGAAVVAVIVSDLALRRRARPDTRWSLAAGLAMVLALVFFILGRSDGPLCDSDSLFQGHALWHVLAAMALSWYFVGTGRARDEVAHS